MRIFLFLISFCFLLGSCNPKVELTESSQLSYELEKLVDHDGIIWSIEFLDDDNIIFTDKEGLIYTYNGSEKNEVLGGPEIYLNRQGGLMDIQLHPDFKDNNTLYITYAKKLDENGGNTTIARAKLNGNSLVDLEDIFVSKQSSEKGTHWGSRIAFDKEGHLYFGIGDRGSRDINPQDLYRDGGKVFRINDDGSIPLDNPYVDKIG
ncbi:MAG: hypothetical protein CNE34_04615, partial [Rhodothermaeota bacterium MED-G18]